MASAVTNTSDIQENFINNILQQSQQNCIATVVNEANNNVVIVNGTNIGGDFTGVSTTTSTDATCLMVSSMEDSVSSILSAIVQQTNKSQTDWFNGFQIKDSNNTFDVIQSVVNNILQINETTCAASTITSASNNYVYVTNANIGGSFIGVTDKADASASCTMTNTMKNTTYNQAQASATQTNIDLGMFSGFLGIIAAIIGVVIVGVIILFGAGIVGYFGYKKFLQKPSESHTEEDIEKELQRISEDTS